VIGPGGGYDPDGGAAGGAAVLPAVPGGVYGTHAVGLGGVIVSGSHVRVKNGRMSQKLRSPTSLPEDAQPAHKRKATAIVRLIGRPHAQDGRTLFCTIGKPPASPSIHFSGTTPYSRTTATSRGNPERLFLKGRAGAVRPLLIAANRGLTPPARRFSEQTVRPLLIAANRGLTPPARRFSEQAVRPLLIAANRGLTPPARRFSDQAVRPLLSAANRGLTPPARRFSERTLTAHERAC
jgi:hypothetical protein